MCRVGTTGFPCEFGPHAGERSLLRFPTFRFSSGLTSQPAADCLRKKVASKIPSRPVLSKFGFGVSQEISLFEPAYVNYVLVLRRGHFGVGF